MKLSFVVLNACLAALIFNGWVFAQLGSLGWGVMLAAVVGLYWSTIQRYRDLKQQYPSEMFATIESYHAKHFGIGKVKGEKKDE